MLIAKVVSGSKTTDIVEISGGMKKKILTNIDPTTQIDDNIKKQQVQQYFIFQMPLSGSNIG